MRNPYPKRRWWKTALKATLFLVALILTLAILAAATLSFLGRRDWAQVKEELIARGEPLSLAEMIPPPLPDAQNFFADPMWEELADLVDGVVDTEGYKMPYKKIRLPKGERTLDALTQPLTSAQRKRLEEAFPEFADATDVSISTLVGKAYEIGKNAEPDVRRRAAEFIVATTACCDPVLSQIEELAKRPGARFPLSFEEFVSLGVESSYFTGYTQLFRIRIWAELVLGNSSTAFRDAVTAFRFQEALAGEPLLISLLVRLASASIALDAIEEGLRARLWTDSELQELDQNLAAAHFPQGVAHALRSERGLQNFFSEQLRRKNDSEFKDSPAYKMWSGPIPSLWLGIFGAGDEARRNTMYQSWIDVLDAAPAQGLNARTFDVFNQDVKALKENWWNRIRYPVTSMAMPNMNGIASVAAQLQDKIAQARTVCALERYRLKYDTYPGELSVLVPDFLPTVPTDISTLQPLRYRREGSGFLLWSPGWNERDEAGKGDDGKWELGARW